MDIRITNPLDLDELASVTLNKYNDPTEQAREGLTREEAEEVAAEDPSLIWGSAALELVDRASGTDMAAEYLGRDTDLPRFDGTAGVQPMDADQYKWWHDVLTGLQAAEDRKAELMNALDEDDARELDEDIQAAGCDLEDLPAVIQRACNRAEFAALVKALEWTVQMVADELGLSKSAIEKRLNGRAAVRAGELAALASFAE